MEMGTDESYICADNSEKDLAIFELSSVLAGHISFGCQKEMMKKYYYEHRDKFISHRL